MEKEIVTIGMFDGVHLGHQRMLKTVVEYAKNKKLRSVVLTFDNIPKNNYGNLSTLKEKIKLIKSIGIKTVKIIYFQKVKNLSPVGFLKKYLKNYSAIVVGYNFRFGKNKEGNINTIKQFYENTMGVKPQAVHTLVVKPVKYESKIISSTNIKELLISGEIERVNNLLRRRYDFEGNVIKGWGLGAKLGFPTANLKVNNNKMLPEGIFIANVKVGKRKYQAIAYIGKRPTFGLHKKTIEIYIINFSDKLYNKKLTIELISKIRNDEKFPTVEKLVKRIEDDIRIAKIYFKTYRQK
ncbi:MAG: bifunctional riboflavin kinase/FAD synthetase [Elusimicrobia bacterium]|nr:bifunctional riboflavin kinase/FAD synthetase [Elusimicrobiota bacterium]